MNRITSFKEQVLKVEELRNIHLQKKTVKTFPNKILFK